MTEGGVGNGSTPPPNDIEKATTAAETGSVGIREADETQALSNARLAAELQAVALALRIGGLDGLRSGTVKIGGKP